MPQDSQDNYLGEVMRRHASRPFFESPHAVTYILILLNCAIFGLTLIGSSLVRIDPATLFHYGALYKTALVQHEYWRLIASAFLHANVLHLGLNMACIAAWSGLLEKRLGATYFIIVYLISAIGGGLASIYGHADAFWGVGASGAISGIVGALLCLTMLGKLPLSPQFFVVTIGVNAMLAARMPNIDWIAHLGGFTAGFAACAVLDGVEAFYGYWLRCKFPEFVKFGIAAAILAAGLLFIELQAANGQDAWLFIGAGATASILAIKIADSILAQRKGLAVLAFATAVLYGSLAFVASRAMTNAVPFYCGHLRSFAGGGTYSSAVSFISAACEHTSVWPPVLAVTAFAAALFFLWPELRRGIGDVGFAASGFRAERKRRQGL